MSWGVFFSCFLPALIVSSLTFMFFIYFALVFFFGGGGMEEKVQVFNTCKNICPNIIYWRDTICLISSSHSVAESHLDAEMQACSSPLFHLSHDSFCASATLFWFCDSATCIKLRDCDAKDRDCSFCSTSLWLFQVFYACICSLGMFFISIKNDFGILFRTVYNP